MKRVAVAGLGAMGWPMAENLVQAGFDVLGLDALGERADAFHRQASGRDDGIESVEALVIMVVNAAQIRSLLFSDALVAGGLVSRLPADACIVQMSTVAPADAAALAAEVAAGRPDLHYVDAPVSGGVVGAKAGTLSIMAAGDAPSLARCRALFDILGQAIFEVGDRPGQGAAMKAVNQLLCGVHIAAAAEALALAEKSGIDRQVALQLVQGSAASSWMLRDRGPRMVAPPGDVTSAIDIFCKDLGIVCDAAGSSRAYTPLAHSAHQLFVATAEGGEGRLDDSQLIRTYRRLNGCDPDGGGQA